jgi:hypothetical protein
MAQKAVLAVVGAVVIGGLAYLLWPKEEPPECESDGDCAEGQECSTGVCVETTSPLESFDAHTNKSLYPGFGTSDLRKPEDYKTTVGVSNCAQWCLDSEDCVAFHHWKEHPDTGVEDRCFYWSSDQSSDTHDTISSALGPGDEGKGSGHLVDAYIKKGKDSLSAEEWYAEGLSSPSTGFTLSDSLTKARNFFG